MNLFDFIAVAARIDKSPHLMRIEIEPKGIRVLVAERSGDRTYGNITPWPEIERQGVNAVMRQIDEAEDAFSQAKPKPAIEAKPVCGTCRGTGIVSSKEDPGRGLPYDTCNTCSGRGWIAGPASGEPK